MTDVRLKEYSSLEGVTMDWLLQDTGLLDETEELATLVRVALGTDALSDVEEILPDPDSTDRRGWWGDWEAKEIWDGWPIGTKNWLLTRAKITPAPASEGSTLERARQYTYDALQPLIDRRIASSAEVVAIRTELMRIEVNCVIYRGPLQEIDLRYQLLWDEVRTPIAILPKIVNHPARPRAANLTLTGPAPSVRPINVPRRDLVLTSETPTVRVVGFFAPARRDLALTRDAPTVQVAKVIPLRNLTLSSTAPTISILPGQVPSGGLWLQTTPPLIN